MAAGMAKQSFADRRPQAELEDEGRRWIAAGGRRWIAAGGRTSADGQTNKSIMTYAAASIGSSS